MFLDLIVNVKNDPNKLKIRQNFWKISFKYIQSVGNSYNLFIDNLQHIFFIMILALIFLSFPFKKCILNSPGKLAIFYLNPKQIATQTFFAFLVRVYIQIWHK